MLGPLALAEQIGLWFTAVVTESESLPDSESSASESTEAVFSSDDVDPSAVTSIWIVADEPSATVPRSHVTYGVAYEHVPWLGVAET
jgi:hypothetical protein